MALAVIAKFNRELESEIWEMRKRLKESRIADTQSTYTPHITLAVCSSLETEKFSAALRQLCQASLPLPLELFGIGQFQDEFPVTYFQVSENRLLRKLQREVFDEATRHGSGVAETSDPARWVPHTTLIGRGAKVQAALLLEKLTTVAPVRRGAIEKLSILDTETRNERPLLTK